MHLSQMINGFIFYIFGYLLMISDANINPFSDDELFAINWAGPADIEKLKQDFDDVDVVSVRTGDNEKYHCILPESLASIDATRKAAYNGATPEELMEALFTQSACSYRIESFWTYELCHGKHVKQYHENRELSPQKPKVQEYYLGKMELPAKDAGTDQAVKDEVKIEATDTEADVTEQKKPAEDIKVVKLDGIDLPYFPVEMDGGSECDLTGKPRKSHVKYICQPNGRGEIYQLKETSSCEYDIIVLTAALCLHPAFKPKDPPVSKIQCHAEAGSPAKPNRLTQLYNERTLELVVEEDEEVVDNVLRIPVGNTDTTTSAKTPRPVDATAPPKSVSPKAATKPVPDTTIGVEADISLLRDFLNGDYCIHGGGGWWKHEFCYNKHAKQYHEDGTSTTTIYLGYWDKTKHLAWLQQNPNKKPKAPSSRKHISLYYSNGDICDLTGKARSVEVKLKCLKSSNQPHAVSIYLVEPDPCNYILGVESPLFCDILEKADENGLLDHIQI